LILRLIKTIFMKYSITIKSFILIAVLAVAAACNNSGKKAEKAVDNGTASRIEV
jgi:hypothetical protein